jgi:hypothetical protein
MNYDEETKAVAQAQEHEPVFLFRVIRIVDQQTVLVREDGLCVFERHAMLSEIERGLLGVPLETEARHGRIVRTTYIRSKGGPPEGFWCCLTFEVTCPRRQDL